MMRDPKKTVAVQMPLDVYERLRTWAQRDGRSVPGEIRQILFGYLEYLDRGGISWCEHRENRGIEQYQA